MVSAPETDEMEENPIKLMTDEEIEEYYMTRVFDFNACEPAKKEELEGLNERREFMARVIKLAEETRDIRQIVLRDMHEPWDAHTDLVHDYFRNPQILQNFYICKNKAFLKLCEIFDVFQFDVFEDAEGMRSFHLCEGPGYFIEATYISAFRTVPDKATWEWRANTLNPYFENTGPLDKLVDDSHIRPHERHWEWGPSGDGDVRKFTEDYLIATGLAGSVDLVTADGSINTQGNEVHLEKRVSPIICAEVRVALKILRAGGRFVLKIYRFTDPLTREAMYQLADNFASIKVIKPMASRPGSCERYLVCDGFGGSCKIDVLMLLQCDDFFLAKQLERIRYHVDTYQYNELLKYNYEQKKQFLMQMKPKLFTAESEHYREKLEELFPRRNRSPWQKMYGNNMVRRFQSKGDPDYILDNFVDTVEIIHPERHPLNCEAVIECIMEQENLFVCSDVEMVVEDTLFMDALTYDVMKKDVPQGYPLFYDMFLPCSSQIDNPSWRDSFYTNIPSYREVIIVYVQGVTDIKSILKAILEGYEMDMTSFTIDGLTSSIPPLFLSRLSASMFVLFYLLFENITIQRNGQWMQFLKRRPYTDDAPLRALLHRLATEEAPQLSIRSFVPLSVLEHAHPHILFQNTGHVIQARRMFEKIKVEQGIRVQDDDDDVMDDDVLDDVLDDEMDDVLEEGEVRWQDELEDPDEHHLHNVFGM